MRGFITLLVLQVVQSFHYRCGPLYGGINGKTYADCPLFPGQCGYQNTWQLTWLDPTKPVAEYNRANDANTMCFDKTVTDTWMSDGWTKVFERNPFVSVQQTYYPELFKMDKTQFKNHLQNTNTKLDANGVQQQYLPITFLTMLTNPIGAASPNPPFNCDPANPDDSEYFTIMTPAEQALYSRSSFFLCDGYITQGCLAGAPRRSASWPVPVYGQYTGPSNGMWNCSNTLWTVDAVNAATAAGYVLDTASSYNNYRGENTGFGSFQKECYCEYSTNACEFREWTSGKNQTCKKPINDYTDYAYVAGKVSPIFSTDFYKGGFVVDLTTPFNHVFNISMMTQLYLPLWFRIQLLVCGEELFQNQRFGLPPPAVLPKEIIFKTIVQPVPIVYRKSTIKSWFKLTPIDQQDDGTGTNTMKKCNNPYKMTPAICNSGWCTEKDSDLYIYCIPYVQKPAGVEPDFNKSTMKYTNTNIQLWGKQRFHTYNLTDDGYYDLIIDATKPIPRTTFSLAVWTKGLIVACQDFDVEVCGLEQYDPRILGHDYIYGTPYAYNEGGGSVQILTQAQYKSYFKINWPTNTQCQIATYNVFEKDSAGNYVKTDHAWIDPVTKNLFVNTTSGTRPFTFPMYIVANTTGGVTAEERFFLQVCGREIVETSVKSTLFYKGEIAWNQNFGDVKPNFSEDYFPYCPIIKWELLDSNLLPYPSTDIALDNNQNLVVNAATYWRPLTKQVYIKASTGSGQSNKYAVQLVMCGGETIMFKGQEQEVRVKFRQKTGNLFIQYAKENLYKGLVFTESEICPIDRQYTELMYQDEIGSYWPYNNDTKVRVDLRNGDLQINTTEVFQLKLFVKIKTKFSPVFYIPIYIQVIEVPDFIWNLPPWFEVPGPIMFNYTVNSFNDVYEFPIPISRQLDDMRKVKWMNISNIHLGSLQYLYNLDSQMPSLYAEQSDYMRYNHSNNYSLTVRIPGGIEEIRKYCGGVYRINVTIQDNQNLTAYKLIMLNLTFDYVWYLNYFKDDIVKIKVNQPGKIQMISVFGEVTIEPNISAMFVPKNFNKTQLKFVAQNSLIQIIPAHQWDQWRLQDLSTLNFTFEVREFNRDRIRYKLNFSFPPGISPYPRYDKLSIKFSNLLSLFNFNKDAKQRELKHVEYSLEFLKGIQKQMYDIPEGRRLVQFIYKLRTILTCLLFASVFIGLMFRAPFNRLFQMIIELQVMCNLVILHVPLPGNVEIAATIFKPWVSFNFFKEMDFQYAGKNVSVSIAEESLEYLGQRQTYNYTSFNLIFNLETVGVFFFIYLIKILITTCITFFLKSTQKTLKHRSKVQKLKGILVDQIIYSDFLTFYLFVFLEFGIACMLALSPNQGSIDWTFANVGLSTIMIVGLFLGTPVVYFMIYEEAKYAFVANYNYRSKFSLFLLGTKLNLGDRNLDRRKHYFSYILMWFGVRYIFLIIAFTMTLGGLQTIFMISLFAFSTAYYGYLYPQHGKWRNRLGVFNQMSILTCCYHLIGVSDWIDQESQYKVGFSLLMTILVFIIVNLLFFSADLVHIIHLMIKIFCPILYVWLELICKSIMIFFAYLRDIILYFYRVVTLFLKRLWTCCPEWPWRKKTLIEPVVEQMETKHSLKVEEDQPPPAPEEPTELQLKLIKGIWTKVYVKISEANKTPGGHNFLKEDPNRWRRLSKLILANYDSLMAKQQAFHKEQLLKMTVITEEEQEHEESSQEEVNIQKSKFKFFKLEQKPLIDHVDGTEETLERSKVQATNETVEPDSALVTPPPEIEKEKTPIEWQNQSKDDISIEVQAPPSITIPKKRKKRKTKTVSAVPKRKFSIFIPADHQDFQVAPALFHDPALFYRDSGKERDGSTLTHDNQLGIVEKNPIFDKNYGQSVRDAMLTKLNAALMKNQHQSMSSSETNTNQQHGDPQDNHLK